KNRLALTRGMVRHDDECLHVVVLQMLGPTRAERDIGPSRQRLVPSFACSAADRARVAGCHIRCHVTKTPLLVHNSGCSATWDPSFPHRPPAGFPSLLPATASQNNILRLHPNASCDNLYRRIGINLYRQAGDYGKHLPTGPRRTRTA